MSEFSLEYRFEKQLECVPFLKKLPTNGVKVVSRRDRDNLFFDVERIVHHVEFNVRDDV